MTEMSIVEFDQLADMLCQGPDSVLRVKATVVCTVYLVEDSLYLESSFLGRPALKTSCNF